MNSNRAFSILALVLIVLFGLFKYWILETFSTTTIYLLDLININPNSIFEWMNIHYERTTFLRRNIGALLYYPIYLSLHLLFIHFLFYKSNVRKILIISLASLVIVLLVGRIVFALLDLVDLQQLFSHLLKTLFGLPFILLAIEGGRILYQDLSKMLDSES